MNEELAEIKYYTTRNKAEKNRKKGEIVYYRKPRKGGYYLVKPEEKSVLKNVLGW